MDAILRIMYHNRISDYDLLADKLISEGVFSAFPSEGKWCFSSSLPVIHNGRTVSQGQLAINDMIVVDREKRIAALVLKKIPESRIGVKLSHGLSIGRSSDNGFELSDRLVSSYHCSFEISGNDVWLCDLNSSNGTYVNDKRISRIKLSLGDVIKVGSYTFLFNGNIIIINADGAVSLHTDIISVSEQMQKTEKEYPYFSPAPRIIPELPPLNITIESAPNIGENPSFGMPGLALSAQLIAVSLGMQALRFALSKHKHSKQESQRTEIYANYLTQIEARLAEHAKLQRTRSLRLHPSLGECLLKPTGKLDGLWERHLSDSDFLTVRLGLGNVPAAASISVPPRHIQLKTDELDEVPSQIAEKYSTVAKCPVFCDLLNGGNHALSGPRELTLLMAKSFATQISALHNYNDVKIVALFSEKEKNEWEWMRWLPHCMSNDRNSRFMLCGKDDSHIFEALNRIVKERINGQNQWQFGKPSQNLPHYVFIVADPSLLMGSDIGTALMMNRPELGISGIFIGSGMNDFPHSVRSFVELSGCPDKLNIQYRCDAEQITLKTDEHMFTLSSFDDFARKMAPIRLPDSGTSAHNLPSSITLFEGLGIKNLKDLDLEDYWNTSAPEETLAVPIGIKANGEKFLFDIHQTVHGPHGLVAGGTGSGKSQMAQTWITSMALQFSPDDVNFVLVDFKGESLLSPFEKLPHLAGSISNLDKDVARSFVALESELEKRQKLLADFGCNDIIEYLRKRRSSPFMPKMPYLILVVDEFAEFKLQFPDFTRALDHLYRGGRSLGLFVVIMTQAPSGIVTDQMKANAAFRWCLSVKSEADSRELLGTTEATSIRNPGRAYVKSGDTYELIQSFFAGAPFDKKTAKNETASGTVYSVSLNGTRMRFEASSPNIIRRCREIDAVVSYINEYCNENHIEAATPLWKKELPEKIDLFSFSTQGLPWNDTTGWTGKITTSQGPCAVVGLVDDPAHQEQFALVHDFWKDGHLAVYGMPVSGKTTILQTVCSSLVNKYSPDDIWIYSIDIGGFGLRSLETFPHVGMAAGDDEPEITDKIISLLEKELDRRKKLFRSVGAGSPGAYAEAVGKALPSIIILSDNLNQASAVLPSFNSFAVKIVREGASYGIYLVCTFTGAIGASYQITQNIKSVYSLTLADKTDYNGIVGRPGNSVPDGSKGSGLVKAMPVPLLFRAAVSHAEMSDSKRISALRASADEMRKSFSGTLPPKVKKLPDKIPFGTVDGKPFVLGVGTESLSTISVDEEQNVSLLISDGSGVRNDIFRSFIRQKTAQEKCRIFMITSSPEKYSDVLNGHTVISEPTELDRAVIPIAELLRSRQNELRENPMANFEPVEILIDNLYNTIKQCNQDTIARLEVFIRLGKNLGLFVSASDTAENMGKCRFSGDILTATMREGSILLAGGAISSHQIADVYALRDKYPQPLQEDEAVLINHSGESIKLKRMLGEQEAKEYESLG